MARLRVDEIVQQHGVYLLATHLDAHALEHHDVVLDVLTNLGDSLVLEYGAENIDIGARVANVEWYVPRLMWLYGKLDADNLTAHSVLIGGLSVETYLLVC